MLPAKDFLKEALQINMHVHLILQLLMSEYKMSYTDAARFFVTCRVD